MSACGVVCRKHVIAKTALKQRSACKNCVLYDKSAYLKITKKAICKVSVLFDEIIHQYHPPL